MVPNATTVGQTRPVIVPKWVGELFCDRRWSSRQSPQARPEGRAELTTNRRTGAVCLPQMQEKAKEIYMTFLSSKASSQVNVEGQSRLNEKILEEPHPLMFQKLQDQVTRPPCLRGDWKPTCLPSRACGGGSCGWQSTEAWNARLRI